MIFRSSILAQDILIGLIGYWRAIPFITGLLPRASQLGSQPTMFMTAPRSRHTRRCVRDATDFEFFISFYCKTTIGQGISEVFNIATGNAYSWKFLVRYIVTGCIFCTPSGLRQGQVLNPQQHPPTQLRGECPPPPPPPEGVVHQIWLWGLEHKAKNHITCCIGVTGYWKIG